MWKYYKNIMDIALLNLNLCVFFLFFFSFSIIAILVCILWSFCPYIIIYISKSWSVAIIVATLLLSHILGHVTIFFFGLPTLLIFYCKINSLWPTWCTTLYHKLYCQYSKLLSALSNSFNVNSMGYKVVFCTTTIC